MQRGMDRVKAAIEAASQPAWPLLGATVIAVLAFYPIAASTENAGEYCASLFSVAAISLLLSWVLSVTVTPLQCVQLLRVTGATAGDAQSSGRLTRGFRALLESAIRHRILTLATAVGLLVAAVVGFGQVTKLFFPDSSMPKFLLDYRLAGGSADRGGGERFGRDREEAARRFSRRRRRQLHRRRPAPLLPAGRPGAALAELRPARRQRPRPSRRRRADGRAGALAEGELPAGHGAAPAVRRRSRSDLEVRGAHLRSGAASGDVLRSLAAKGEAILRQSPLTGDRADQLAAAGGSSSSRCSTTLGRAGPA